MAIVRAALVGFTAMAAFGCDAGVRGRTGYEAMLRVANATYVDGPLTTAVADPAAGGPLVTIGQIHSLVYPGADKRALSGSVQQGAVSVAVGLADDVAYWIIPASTANMEVGGGNDLLFSTTLSYALDLAPGRHDLVLRALLPGGGFGPPAIQVLTVGDAAQVTGAMVVTLGWTTNADLDLHVVAPNPPDSDKPDGTTEVWVNNPSSLPTRPFTEGGPYTPEELAAGGQLDIDSNGGCVIDGRRAENVVWGAAPPSGHYLVRVDAVSMCGEASAQWQIVVTLNGAVVGSAYGQMGDSDTRFDHGQGAGLLALELDVP